MPSASISSHASMSQLMRDSYQANGLIRTHQQHAIGSSQTSLQKQSASSPQFMYQFSSGGSGGGGSNNNNSQQPQSMMQFHSQPAANGSQTAILSHLAANPAQPQKPHAEGNALLQQYNQMLGPGPQAIGNLAVSSMQAHLCHHPPPSGEQPASGPPNSNNTATTLMQPTNLMQPLAATKNSLFYSSNQQLHPSQQLYNASYLQQPPPPPQPLQLANSNSNNQQVPLTTIMVPAAIASQLQSLSLQIQQAALQTAPSLQQNPQILVFMIPYMMPSLVPAGSMANTPEQASQNSTLVRQSHSNSSMVRHQAAQVRQQQQQQQQIQQQVVAPAAAPSHGRAVSSLSNNTLTGSVASSAAATHQAPSQAAAIESTANSTASRQHQHKEPEKFYIKANFSYQPSRQSGDSRSCSSYRQQAYRQQELSFRKGDILHVLDTLLNNDLGAQYWLATRVKPNGEDAEKGLIPNRNKAEEITIEQRTMDVGERGGASGSSGATGSMADGSGGGGTMEGGGGGVLSASVGRVSFLKRRSAQRSKSLCKDNWDNVVFDIGNFRMQTYERVVYKHPGFCRPVVIFGPLSDLARQKLLKDYPEKYSYPTGLSQSPDHPKVIRLKGILDVLDQGKHALLDITAQAVERLNYVNLAPIVIFMKSESKSVIKEFRSRAAKSLDPNARDEDTLRRDGKSSRKLLEQSVKLEKQWFHVFTAVLNLSSMGSEMWYRKLRETIESQQSANVWMGEKKQSEKRQLAAGCSSASSPANANSLGVSEGCRGAALCQSGSQSRPSRHSSNGALNPAANILHQAHQMQPAQPLSLADSSSMLNEKFSECLNLSTAKSHNDLLPHASIDAGLYGNRSQLRNAYAHSLAQKLARASSEPKLNGLMSDQDDDDGDLERDRELGARLAGGCNGNGNDHDDDDDDDEYDEELIKKPLSPFDNSSSISSSNGIAGGALGLGLEGTSFGHSSLQGTSSTSSQAHLQQLQRQLPYQQLQHASSSYQVLPPLPPPPQQQLPSQHQSLGKPPAPLPPQAVQHHNHGHHNNHHHQQQQQIEQSMGQQQQQQQQHLGPSEQPHQLSASRSFMAQVQESIYSMTGPNAGSLDPSSLMSGPSSASTTGLSMINAHNHQLQQQQQQQALRSSDYHPLPPMPSAGESVYSHSSQQLPSASMHPNGGHKGGPNNDTLHPHPALPNHNGNPNTNGGNQVISGHADARGGAYQIYSDMNQNNYHYYNLNKI